MLEVNVREARQNLSRLLDQVEQGNEVQITRKGKIVARLVPEVALADPKQVLREAASLRESVAEKYGARDNPVLAEREEARY